MHRLLKGGVVMYYGKHFSVSSLISILCSLTEDMKCWNKLWENRKIGEGPILLDIRRDIWEQQDEVLETIYKKGGYEKWCFAKTFRVR